MDHTLHLAPTAQVFHLMPPQFLVNFVRNATGEPVAPRDVVLLKTLMARQAHSAFTSLTRSKFLDSAFGQALR